MSDRTDIEGAVSHMFRHQSGRIVAVLTRIFGTHNIELAEDVVQDTLITALDQWKIKGIPQDPEGWLFIVAKNKALNVIKRQKSNILFGDDETQSRLLESGYTMEHTFHQLADESRIGDDQLRMMYACCHPGISAENQMALILKTLCGFSTAEIARAFLTSEETISKRLYRTKEFFRKHKVKLSMPEEGDLSLSTEAVLNTIYLIFNEGYNSTKSEYLIRKDVIADAMMLCKLMLDKPETNLPEVNALMSLMCFHAARLDSRMDSAGEMILLQAQNRSQWDEGMISQGMYYMSQAAKGDRLSTYHLQAAIASEHCSAKHFDETDWNKILTYYDWMMKMAPSPVTALNRLVAILHLQGPERALAEAELLPERAKLSTYYLYHSLLADIHGQLGHHTLAAQHLSSAIRHTQSETERRMLTRKMEKLTGRA